jgi:hypothetical protein
MSKLKHTSIMSGLLSIADDSEPLAEKKNPMLAAAIALVCGGIGLGIYLRSWRDFWIPCGILLAVLVLGVTTGETLMVVAPGIWAAYGYRRVVVSNAKLDGGRKTNPIIEAEIVSPPPIPTRREKLPTSLRN